MDYPDYRPSWWEHPRFDVLDTATFRKWFSAGGVVMWALMTVLAILNWNPAADIFFTLYLFWIVSMLLTMFRQRQVAKKRVRLMGRLPWYYDANDEERVQ